MIVRDLMLFFHFVGLSMAVGVSFCMMALGMATAKLEEAERSAFMLRALVLSKVASIGFALLIVTGLGLLFFDGAAAVAKTGGVYFHAKMGFLVIQIGLFGFMQATIAKVKREGGGPLMARLPKIGTGLQLNGLLVVLMAVFAFH